MYKAMPTDVRPMKLDVSSKVFASVWKECWKNPNKDIMPLLDILDPFFKHWIYMLTEPGSEKDINYITLCFLIEGCGPPAPKAIKKWVRYGTHSVSLYEEFQLMAIEYLRTVGYFPSLASPIMVEYVIARDLKLRLAKKIVKAYKQSIDIPVEASTFNTLTHEDHYPDYFMLNQLTDTQWNLYLSLFVTQGLPTLEIAEITKIPRITFYYEERELWHKLKKN